MKVLITGGAGFIGSHLVDRLLREGHYVTVIDNMSSGRPSNIEKHMNNKNFRFVRGDIRDIDLLKNITKGQDMVWHLAANADIRKGMEETRVDLENNVLGTYNLLEAMRHNNVNKMAFSSSSTVYGEATIPTPENHSIVPISLYAASKIADEAAIECYAKSFGFRVWIFRFANIVGPRHRRGAIHDFILKLKEDPKSLLILGDGKQEKSYLYIDECIDCMQFAIEKSNDDVNIFNLGNDDKLDVNNIADIVIEEMKLKNVKKTYTGGDRGWIGDIPKTFLAIDKIKGLGWKSKSNSLQTVKRTVKELVGELV